MKNPTLRNTHHSRGSALLVVLAFLLLLTTLTIAFLSRATLERQLSNGSFSQGKVDLAGQGAIAAIVGDLQQEIVAGSNVGTPTVAAGYYYPTSPLTAVPSVVGFTPGTGLENLLKISYRSTKVWPATSIYTMAGPTRAAAVSTVTASLNNRSVTPRRWNKPLLLAPNSATDFTPSSANFVIPDWIYVARDGSNPTSWTSANIFLPSVAPTTATGTTAGTNPVTQRYAYAVYDEGGTLDMNFAGSPVTAATTPLTYSTLQPYKNALAYADLTQLPGITGLTPAAQMAFVNAIVGWRNFASAGLAGSTYTFPYTSSIPSTPTPLPFDTNLSLSSANGFLGVGGTQLSNGPNVQGKANQSDNPFTSRQQLLQFFLQGLGQNSTFTANVPLSTLVNVMPYLGTFSRDISQPSFGPLPANATADTTHRPAVVSIDNGGNNGFGGDVLPAQNKNINPPFLSVVPSASYTRADGSTASTSEPLVKKRFALSRLCWLTYQGPSATRTQYVFGSPSPGVSSTDYDMWAMVNVYGVPSTLLAQGTAVNIQKYFGLSWVTDSSITTGINDGTSKWKYVHGSNVTGSGVGSTTPGSILTLYKVSQLSPGRDADFFELLKAGITVGAIAKPGTTPVTKSAPAEPLTPGQFQSFRDQSINTNIIQIGANIIDQAKVDSYCTRIIFDDGSWAVPQEYRGIQDLPYLYKIQGGNIPLQSAVTNPTSYSYGTGGSNNTATVTTQGLEAFMQLPVIWNPHTWNPNKTVVTGLRPTSFRIIMVTGDPNNYGTTLGSVVIGNTNAQGSSPLSDTSTATPPGPLPATPTKFTTAKSEAAMTFTIPSARLDLFREPTMLCKPNVPSGSSLAIDTTTSGAVSLLTSDTAISSYASGGVLTASSAYSGYASCGVTDDLKYIGLYMGSAPVVWPVSSGGIDAGMYVSVSGNTNFTFRLQYLDPIAATWVTYDEKYSPICSVAQTNNTVYEPSTPDLGSDSIIAYYDPRSNRWGPQYNYEAWVQYLVQQNPPGDNPQYNWVCAGQNILQTQRPDQGFGFVLGPSGGSYNTGFYPGNNVQANTSPLTGASEQNSMYAYNLLSPSSYRYGSSSGGAGNGGFVGADFYTDADGVCRRAMSAWVPFGTSADGSPATLSGTPTGLPLAMSTTFSPATSSNFTTVQIGSPSANGMSRPIVLNRPFRSVGELGYVFSDTPWRNLDFFTPESGYSTLMDIFCINDTNNPNALVAGKVDLNTRQTAVLSAVLAGAYKEEYYTSGYSTFNGTSSAPLSSAEVASIAGDASNGLVARTTSTTSGKGPIQNLSELVGKWVSPQTIGTSGSTTLVSPNNIDGGGNPANTASFPGSYGGFSSDLNNLTVMTTNPMWGQRYRESAVRALSTTTTTRIWNLMIDVIAQTGRFPATAGDLSNFNVEGERRYWVHVAIDRYTGKVLDQQVEEVKE